VLLQNAFGITESPLFFDTMVHLGTLVAVVIVMWREIMALFKKPFITLLLLVLASIPAGAVGYFFRDFFEGTFSGVYLGYGFLLTAVFLTLAEQLADRAGQKKPVRTGGALAMGVMQAVAIFPGVSRSGSTIAGGLAFGVERRQAARFSFLMSIPVILASVLLQGVDVVREAHVSAVDIVPVLAGTVCAAVAGYIAVRFMLALIQKKRLYGFAIYVAVLGAFVLLDQNIFHLIPWA